MGTEGTPPLPLERGIPRLFLGEKRGRKGSLGVILWHWHSSVTGLVALVALSLYGDISGEEQGWGWSRAGN